MRGRPRHPDILTPAEWRVLDQLRNGKTNGEIAERLGLSINTVKYHVANILSKLELESREDIREWREHRQLNRARVLDWWKWAAIGTSAGAVAAVGIVLASQGGSTPQRVTPNQHTIAFIGGDDPTTPLHLVDSRNGREWTVGEFVPQPPYSLAWSPDRKSIAFLWNASVPNCPPIRDQLPSCLAPMPDERLLVLNGETGELFQRAAGIGSNQGSIGWSDDNVLLQTALADASAGAKARLYRLDELHCSAISFRGTTAVCSWWNPANDREQEIRIGNVDAGFSEAAQLSRIVAVGYEAWPRLSYDRHWVAWNRTDLDRYQLLLSRVPPSGQVESEAKALGVCSDAHWSPTERKLMCMQQLEGDGRHFSIVLHHAEDESSRVIGTWPEVRDVAWSPDGTQIAFIAETDHEMGEIYVVNGDGSGLRRLTFNETWESELAWASE